MLICAALAGCGSSSGTSSSTSSSSSSSTDKSLGSCTASTIYHEQQFKNDASLKATFDDIAVDHLETTATNDVISYTVTDGPRTFTVTLGSSAVATAVLKDANGAAVLTMNKGDAATDVTLQDGNYTLTLTSDGSADGLIFVVPSSCVSSAASSNVGVTQSLSKAATVATPGVYITEIPDATSIASEPTNVTVMIGVAGQGSVNTPVLMTSVTSYTQTFGAVSINNAFSMAVWQFFTNGGQTLYVINAASDSVADLTTALGHLADVTSYNILVIPDLAFMTQANALSVIGAALPIVYGDKAMMIIDYPTSIITSSAVTAFATQVVAAAPTTVSNAAIYFPSITAESPAGVGSTLIGNGSSVAGAYANTDVEVGVWKSPAGVVNGQLLGVQSLPVALSNDTVETLSLSGINPIWNLPNYGIVIWGDKTLSQDADFKYLSVRRTILSIEQSINQGLQWAVFEPNDALTWQTVSRSISEYLTVLWQQGALLGDTASDAFTVECGLGSTMIAQDILNGYLIVQVSLSLVEPADYIVLQFTLQIQSD